MPVQWTTSGDWDTYALAVGDVVSRWVQATQYFLPRQNRIPLRRNRSEEHENVDPPPQPDQRMAHVRARTLLLRLLNDDDRRYFDQHGIVRVTGSDGGVYELDPAWTGNVRQYCEANGRWRRWCAHIRSEDEHGYPIPIDDNLVAQLLTLRTDEREFHRIANPY